MKHTRISAFIGFFAVFFILLPVATMASQVTTTRDCGAYHYDIRRITDGFFVTAVDYGRTRTILYRDVIAPSSLPGDTTNVISGCADASLAFVHSVRYRYGSSQTVDVIDPTGPYLRIVTIGTKTTSTVGDPNTRVSVSPVEREQLINELLSRPTEYWTIEHTELVTKSRTAVESPNILTDKSFFVFDGKGGYIKRNADSSWNTVLAVDTAFCANGTTYVLYEKIFHEWNTSTSTSPNIQYVIERSGNGPRTLIPVPYVDRSWQSSINGSSVFSSSHGFAEFGACMGANASVIVRADRATSANRVTLITPQTTFVDYMSPARSIEAGYIDANGMFSPGRLYYNPNSGVTGSSVISELHPDGTVTQRKPLYFRDITSYANGALYDFRRDSTDPSRITVVVEVWSGPEQGIAYYMETDGAYLPVRRQSTSWRSIWGADNSGTGLYLSAEKDMITVNSFYLSKPMLLHYLPNTAYTLNGYRIGPLELDGTRKIWYELTVHGKKEMWFARVR